MTIINKKKKMLVFATIFLSLNCSANQCYLIGEEGGEYEDYYPGQGYEQAQSKSPLICTYRCGKIIKVKRGNPYGLGHCRETINGFSY